MNVPNIHILIVDDNKKYAAKLGGALKETGSIDIVHSEDDFRKAFAPYRYDVIILDLRLREGKEGLDLLNYIIEDDPSASVIVVSGYGDIATAVEALQKGAKTFLEKDKASLQEIRMKVEHVIKESASEKRIRQLEASQESDEIVGNDLKIMQIKNLTRLVAQDGETTVLIRGETGTGKELVAKAVHRLGVRKDGPFISVALTDVNPDTITSELFGHERGSFTGATTRHHGFFEQAHKGVLFMDEIGDLPLEIQLKLLRVLDQKKFRRMGGDEDIIVDVQVVTATNKSLEDAIAAGKFREDLYYRLKVFEIFLPPLRERGEDISLIATQFLLQLKKKGRTTAKGFSVDAIQMMMQYKWPGNVRELLSVVESAALRSRLAGSEKITGNHLAPLLLPHGMPLESQRDIKNRLAEVELHEVEAALKRCEWKKTEAWKLLNYPNRFAMTRKVKKILTEYPDIAAKFPELKRIYS